MKSSFSRWTRSCSFLDFRIRGRCPLLLLVVSNDISMRSMGILQWKSLQRWAYVACALTVAHGIAYQLIEKRRLPWVFAFAALTLAILVMQALGYLRITRSTGSDSSTDRKSVV